MPRYGPQIPIASPVHRSAVICLDQLLSMKAEGLVAYIQIGNYPEALMDALGIRNTGYSAFGEAIRLVANDFSRKGKIWEEYGDVVYKAHERLHKFIKMEERRKYGLEGWEYEWFA